MPVLFYWAVLPSIHQTFWRHWSLFMSHNGWQQDQRTHLMWKKLDFLVQCFHFLQHDALTEHTLEISSGAACVMWGRPNANHVNQCESSLFLVSHRPTSHKTCVEKCDTALDFDLLSAIAKHLRKRSIQCLPSTRRIAFRWWARLPFSTHPEPSPLLFSPTSSCSQATPWFSSISCTSLLFSAQRITGFVAGGFTASDALCAPAVPSCVVLHPTARAYHPIIVFHDDLGTILIPVISILIGKSVAIILYKTDSNVLTESRDARGLRANTAPDAPTK